MEMFRTDKFVILNTDDFGSRGVTGGVLRSHREGVLISTALVAKMPAAAATVKRLVKAPELGVRVHLNVSQGPPLSRLNDRLASRNYTSAFCGWIVRMFCGSLFPI